MGILFNNPLNPHRLTDGPRVPGIGPVVPPSATQHVDPVTPVRPGRSVDPQPDRVVGPTRGRGRPFTGIGDPRNNTRRVGDVETIPAPGETLNRGQFRSVPTQPPDAVLPPPSSVPVLPPPVPGGTISTGMPLAVPSAPAIPVVPSTTVPGRTFTCPIVRPPVVPQLPGSSTVHPPGTTFSGPTTPPVVPIRTRPTTPIPVAGGLPPVRPPTPNRNPRLGIGGPIIRAIGVDLLLHAIPRVVESGIELIEQHFPSLAQPDVAQIAEVAQRPQVNMPPMWKADP